MLTDPDHTGTGPSPDMTPVTDIHTMPPGELATDMDTDGSYNKANVASGPPGLSAPGGAMTVPSGSPEGFTTAKGDIPSLPDHQIRMNGGSIPPNPFLVPAMPEPWFTGLLKEAHTLSGNVPALMMF